MRGAFFVLAPFPHEESVEFDRIASDEPAELVNSVQLAALVALSLHTVDGTRVFADAEAVAASLDDGEFMHVTEVVFSALSRIAPSHRRSSFSAWQLELRRGAAHPSNLALGERLALSVDAEILRGAIPRPDRFFGVSMPEVTDGQWWAFEAARWYHITRRLENVPGQRAGRGWKRR